ncbi:MAG: alpha/beta fold hydrolase [Rhodospirillaceae bacterium]|nr:alpha/beta fold hydrolase [Rhodospirillaceae bacterium]
MSDRLDWDRDGSDWPNRKSSRFVTAAGLRWHVQRMGAGPCLLLAHGTGASTHSWRDLAPLLARHFTVLAPDLPGHGFTDMPAFHQMSLPSMAKLLQALLDELGDRPQVAVGHSAGAAILARMCLDGALTPQRLISMNGALLPIGGVAGKVFSPLAKLLASSSVPARLFALRAGDRTMVLKLLRDTGSRIDATGAELYARLARNPGHVGAALAMMANWELGSLSRALPKLKTPLVLVAGSNDRTIPSADAYRVHAMLPSANVLRLKGLGHLAHEEQPYTVTDLILKSARIARSP